jgi:hypothetical protein
MSKTKIPKLKHQITNKHQIPMTQTKKVLFQGAFVLEIGIWKLEFIWNLEFVIWDFISYYYLPP